MIYLDNAATGGFKPSAVLDVSKNVLKYLSANPGRSGHRLSITGAELVYRSRLSVSRAFNCPTERVIFTKNCTEALNTAIFGLLKQGDHVITTVYEHNSVLRPLYHLKNLGIITLDIVSPLEDSDIVREISKKITPQTKLVAVTSASNVTGEVMPITNIGLLAKSNGIKLLVDGAQGAGHVKLDMKKDNISVLTLACHKGLYGIMGSGVLAFDDSTEISPLTFGGTGIDTFNKFQPDDYPERLESGTLNLPAISAISEGVEYAMKNLTNFSKNLEMATEKLITNLSEIDGVKIYSKPNPTGIVSFMVQNVDSNEIAQILNDKYDIAVRGGFHCAPLMHKHLKTDRLGLVRVSLAVQNTTGELNYLVKAVREIIKLKSF
ncbi:MAG: aminotransferase class V-fold PLP-dependent enzyme [Clostridia bacterium]|nr:aminotransferase class V-fold PLP-dependent enzyme [Clostridia bacterium]